MFDQGNEEVRHGGSVVSTVTSQQQSPGFEYFACSCLGESACSPGVCVDFPPTCKSD